MAAKTKSRMWAYDCLLQSMAIALLLQLLAGLHSCQANTDGSTDKLNPSDIVFIVMSQPNQYHLQRANELHRDFNDQMAVLGFPVTELTFLHLHEEWPEMGWTIIPVLPDLAEKYKSKKFVCFFEDETEIAFDTLMFNLQNYDFTDKLFLGNGLRDRDATIIHHFAFHKNPGSFVYPDFAAGLVMSMSLVQHLAHRYTEFKPNMDFSIDAKHELAKYIWDEGKGTQMTEVPFLCTVEESTECATSYTTKMPDCGEPVLEDSVFIAVKTYHGFHKDRVSVVKNTWGPTAKRMEFYSDVEDPDIPTVDLGVPNTERGHCGKMLAIMKKAHEDPEISKADWLAIVDDDTLISIPRLRKLLACYNPAEPVALGERYGYGVASGRGYNYITGGGGMVLSHSALDQLMSSELCKCASNDSPDDMALGMWLKRLGIPVTHSPLFHQARPADYSVGYLSHQMPISFHKHWMIDPVKVYEEWLKTDTGHDEL